MWCSIRVVLSFSAAGNMSGACACHNIKCLWVAAVVRKERKRERESGREREKKYRKENNNRFMAPIQKVALSAAAAAAGCEPVPGAGRQMGKKQITNATYLRLVRLSTKRETKGASVKQTNVDNNNNNYYGKQTNSGPILRLAPSAW